MTYESFSLQSVVSQFDLKYLGSDLVFPTVLPELPANADEALTFLTQQLDRDIDIVRRNPSDPAKSAFIIAPVLATLRQIHHVGIHAVLSAFMRGCCHWPAAWPAANKIIKP